jgi:hypothetical protein
LNFTKGKLQKRQEEAKQGKVLGCTIKPEKTDCHYHYLITNLKKCPEFDSGDLGGDRYMNVDTILTVPWLMRQQARERERERERAFKDGPGNY